MTLPVCTWHLWISSATAFMSCAEILCCRWKLERSGDISIDCNLWNHPLDIRRTAIVDLGSCRAHGHNVHLLVQLQQRKGRVGEQAVLGMGWLVRERDLIISSGFLYFISLRCITEFETESISFCAVPGFASGQHCFSFFSRSSTLAPSSADSRGWRGSFLACWLLFFSCSKPLRWVRILFSKNWLASFAKKDINH